MSEVCQVCERGPSRPVEPTAPPKLGLVGPQELLWMWRLDPGRAVGWTMFHYGLAAFTACLTLRALFGPLSVSGAGLFALVAGGVGMCCLLFGSIFIVAVNDADRSAYNHDLACGLPAPPDPLVMLREVANGE